MRATREPVVLAGDETRSGRLRVLVLSRSYPNDVLPGLGLWVEKPTLRLSERCDVHVVSPSPWCPPLPGVGPLRQYTRFRAVPRTERRSGIDIDRPRMLVGFGQSLHRFEGSAYHAAVARTVAALRERFDFDLVHAHFIYPDGAVARRLAREHGVPYVVSEHAPWIPWLEQSGVREQALTAAADAAFLLPVSSSVKATITRFVPNRDEIRVVPIGVDGSMFRLSANGARRPGRVLFVGLIKYVKGIDVLLEAMRTVTARDDEAHLVLAGGSFYRHTRLQLDELKRLPAKLGIEDRVSFVGPQPIETVAELMRESSVVVLPSRAESFGAVLVEALASGTPVVATACGGPEDIVDERVGRLVPTEDPTALADAILSVLRHPERYRPDDLRAYALERFAWERVAEQLHDVYREALRR